jgi:hypothetical protein
MPGSLAKQVETNWSEVIRFILRCYALSAGIYTVSFGSMALKQLAKPQDLSTTYLPCKSVKQRIVTSTYAQFLSREFRKLTFRNAPA